jgi:hypothetical protein
VLKPHSQPRTAPASPSSADKPETAALPPIPHEAECALVRTIPAAFFSRGVICFLARLLTKRAAQELATEDPSEKKNEIREEDNEENETRRTQTTAGHEPKRYLAPARRSA